MSQFEIIMPKMGESVLEATITKWLKQLGDTIQEDDAIAEIATDKVDSEIPSPVEGILTELKYQEGDVVAVGKVIAVIETDTQSNVEIKEPKNSSVDSVSQGELATDNNTVHTDKQSKEVKQEYTSSKFYSPLVRTIAKEENVSLQELDSIKGSGKDDRVTKQDVLDYIAGKTVVHAEIPKTKQQQLTTQPIAYDTQDSIIEMDRMRKLIADHMVNSVHTSPHVTSFIEVRMGQVVRWREKMKKQFEQQYNQKLTYTHIILEAVSKALLEFPQVNASVDGYNIILRKQISIGMATALPNGNLIVPVIKNADQKNLLGIVKDVNRLAHAARTNTLSPDDIAGGTFTFTNLGSFGSLTGTPIINQPQVAILGAGVIQKKPVVFETQQGDMIGIEPIMILSLSYDHRIVDGALGGMFIKRVAELLEQFDLSRTV
jgi:2-oxoglutarate dehydrogenase E2 component (dihydrolipoamide succinyltransferase)